MKTKNSSLRFVIYFCCCCCCYYKPLILIDLYHLTQSINQSIPNDLFINSENKLPIEISSCARIP